MWHGYLELDGVEILNAARTKAYVDRLRPTINVKCAANGLRLVLGHLDYFTPAGDNAPWYVATRPATGKFYGFFPVDLEGGFDSTRKISVTELTGDGAIHAGPRFGSKEMRFKTVAIAEDDEGLAEGMAWLRDIMAHSCVPSLTCTGRQARMFTATPKTSADSTMSRDLFRVEVIEAPIITERFNSLSGAMMQVEFTLSVGIPWVFTPPTVIATLNMNSALNHTDASGEDCSLTNDAYENFINDPFFTGISQPPQAPNILPPNILDLSSWRRLTTGIPTIHTDRHGRIVPIVTVSSGAAAAQYVRIRFYNETVPANTGCDYDGEFLVSYIPANSTLVLDPRQRLAYVEMSDGRTLQGGHLLYGTDGRPFLWPDLGCYHNYTMTVDQMPGQNDIVVTLDVAVKE